MNKNASKPQVQGYVCRKCTQKKFRNSMEFTKHLEKCSGSASEIKVPALALVQNVKPDAKILADLIEASIKAGELKAALDRLIKRLK